MACLGKSFTDDKILSLSKLKELADDNFSEAQLMQFYSESVENIVRKGENAGYKHFVFFFPTMLSRGSFHKVVISRGCVVEI